MTLSGNLYVNNAAARILMVTNTGATTLSGNVYLSDLNTYGGSLTISNTAASGGVTISGTIANFNGSGTAGSLTKIWRGHAHAFRREHLQRHNYR